MLFGRILRWLSLMGVVCFPLFSKRHVPDFSDWAVYAEAGEKMAAAQTVYDVVGHYQFKYAPFIAAVFAGLSRVFSLETLARVNWAAELILFFVLLGFAGFFRQISEFSNRRFLLLLGVVAALALPLRDELKLGQVNLWCLLLLFGAWFWAHRGHSLRAALFWTIAISLKLYSLIFAPYWIFRRQWKLLGGVLFFHAILNIGVVAAWIGPVGAWTEHLDWLRTLSKSSLGLLESHYNVSIFKAFANYGGSHSLTLAIWGAALLYYVKESWDFSRQRPFSESAPSGNTAPHMSFFGRSLAWILLLNPLVWSYWYVFLIFVLIPNLDKPGFFAGKIAIPRWLWSASVVLLVLVTHRHNTPIALAGASTGILGFVLLSRPSATRENN